MRFSVFLPSRKGSKRVINKNTRQFAGFKGGLLQLKLGQLLNSKLIDEVVLSTNDEYSIEIANLYFGNNKRLKISKRPDLLAEDSTNLSDLIKYAPSVCSFDNILWTHVTSPFINSAEYDKSIKSYNESLEKGFDSLMSVKLFKSFLWDDKQKDIINRGKNNLRWPRTQDLKSLYEINSGIFIANKKIYYEMVDRVGKNPFLFEQDSIKSFDIDWSDDFKLAELIITSMREV